MEIVASPKVKMWIFDTADGMSRYLQLAQFGPQVKGMASKQAANVLQIFQLVASWVVDLQSFPSCCH